jgi:N-acetyl sugar amidotransferase
MDTSDSLISFDGNGVCEYCNNYKSNILPKWRPGKADTEALTAIVEKIKTQGQGKKYDCLIGLSGGVDSSYVAYYAVVELGLRPLLFVVDTGWNLPVADENVANIVEKLGCDVHTEVIDWEEMKDLQLAYFKSQVAAQDSPQDHAIFAALFEYAAKNKFKYVLTGANYSTECVREPLEWHYHASDVRQLKDIHKKNGSRPLKRFPLCDIFKSKIFYKGIRGIKSIPILNYLPYQKEMAIATLSEELGWQRYQNKHYESVFTRFYEGYWLIKKFGFDKRRAHFSSLILTGQLAREDALRILEQPPYDEQSAMDDMEHISEKLGITKDEFLNLMAQPNKTYKDYKNEMAFINIGTKVMRLLGKERKIMR